MIMSIIWMIVLGLIVGWIAKLVVPGSAHLGWVSTSLLGIAGGWVGGTLGSLVFSPHQFDITPPIKHSFLGALVGAVILLLIYRSFARRGTKV
ncbi:MAG: GlsB/YeaQ/YmgE family stress response membrane protein [Mycobacterium sp.]|nr:GlsB/YeaQ/YmgE family stress response membrane protein [Mycobacterium sp.]